MPKKQEEESAFGLLSKKESPPKKEEGPRRFREATPPRKFREAEPSAQAQEKAQEKTGTEQRIKFKLGASEAKSGDAGVLSPGGLGLVDYSSDDEEEETAEKDKEKDKEGGESSGEEGQGGNGQVRERAGNGEDIPQAKRMRMMDERDEYARSSPPQSTAT